MAAPVTRVRPGPGPAEAVAAVAVLVGLEFMLTRALATPVSRSGVLAFTGGIRVVETGLGMVWWHLRGWGLGPLGLVGSAGRRGLAVGTAVALGFGALVISAEVIGRLALDRSLLTSLSGGLPPPRDPTYPALLLVGALVAPIAEEFWFRGVLYGSLRSKTGPVITTTLVTALFALAHLPQTHIPWTQAVGGILFCAAYEAAGSLWAPVVVHVTGNLAVFLLPLVVG